MLGSIGDHRTEEVVAETMDAYIEGVKNILEPAENAAIKWLKLMRRKQLPYENAKEFIAALRLLARGCGMEATDEEGWLLSMEVLASPILTLFGSL